ncbi:MAG: SIMPL domain-containing protein [Balneola sp.]|nr:MAG: SIMPL domain-containing protein [Balneola sp.]
MKKTILSVSILCITAIIITLIGVHTYHNRNQASETIFVTGLGSKDFKSDLIVWSGSFSKQAKTLGEAYDLIKEDQDIISDYLTDKGVTQNEFSFSSVSISKENKSVYNENGKYIRSDFVGYRLTQQITIESKQVDHVEQISRDITEIINEGVEFYSYSPSYYYTGLAELKIEMIAAATEDARTRAEQIASRSKADLGDLKHAQMGIFQIIAQHSNDDYSWGGTFNTSSKMKTATITMRLRFDIGE